MIAPAKSAETPPAPPLKAAASGDEGNHKELDKPFWQQWEFWTAAGTVFLGIATLWLVRKTDGLIKSAERSAERQLRAYVMVTLKGVEIDPENDGMGHIEIHNRGQTPAHDVAVFWAMSVAPKNPAPGDIDYFNERASSPDGGSMLLGPGEHRGASNTCKPFSDDEAIAVLKDRAWLYVTGRVEYVDAFNERRTTRFCHIYSGLDLGADGGRYAHYGNSCT